MAELTNKEKSKLRVDLLRQHYKTAMLDEVFRMNLSDTGIDDLMFTDFANVFGKHYLEGCVRRGLYRVAGHEQEDLKLMYKQRGL